MFWIGKTDCKLLITIVLKNYINQSLPYINFIDLVLRTSWVFFRKRNIHNITFYLQC